MATRCRKMTTKALIARTEREAGRKLNAAERAAVSLQPPQYVCGKPKRKPR